MAVLIPWTVYLGLSLRHHYEAGHWTLTWVGFDTLLVAMLAVTAYLGARRRQLLIPASSATGVLLLCDAWFDITTANPHDLWASAANAALVEVPAAALLVAGSLRLIRLLARRLWLLDDGGTLWQVELPFFETHPVIAPPPGPESG